MKYITILFLSSIAFAGNDKIKVAVIDTGIDITHHPELSEVLCSKADQFNGTTKTIELPKDTAGHGTHVAGIIRALAGNKNYCLAICKFYDVEATDIENADSTVECFKFAKRIHANYVNYSAGGRNRSNEEKRALKSVEKAILIVAAGNNNENLDNPSTRFFPASYWLSNEIVVGAVDKEGQEKVDSSNYGSKVIFYPGEDVYSTLPKGKFGYMTGSSQATAIATGIMLRKALGLEKIESCWQYIRDFWTSN